MSEHNMCSQCKSTAKVILRDGKSYCCNHAIMVSEAFFCELCQYYVNLPGNWNTVVKQSCGHVYCICCLRDRFARGQMCCPCCDASWDVDKMWVNLANVGDIFVHVSVKK